MGFSDNFANMKASEQGAFGCTITYTPSDGVTPPFSTTAIFENFIVDQIETRVMRDLFTARIDHSSLVSGGITEPTVQTMNQAGDTITRDDIEGNDEIWVITQAEPDQDYGEWVLTIEKDVRFIP